MQGWTFYPSTTLLFTSTMLALSFQTPFLGSAILGSSQQPLLGGIDGVDFVIMPFESSQQFTTTKIPLTYGPGSHRLPWPTETKQKNQRVSDASGDTVKLFLPRVSSSSGDVLGSMCTIRNLCNRSSKSYLLVNIHLHWGILTFILIWNFTNL